MGFAGIGFFGSLILGALAGWIAEKVMNSDMGLLANIGLGIVGAFVANFLLGFFLDAPLGAGSWIMQLVVGTAGACALIWTTRKLRGRA
ncbi:GlsB/YeaQ/YmgE family stress response membrane protein [Jannaschia sp. Os4]|uniref:GlsB/YeaQ/YmgE family stress response membrane protein n=1 Tax=Jannaschia sp. Os4 TaxID=2807617 RepID=UPI00193A6721|nr:GlsB/YeaQ/YmgE family stress response membrane protein [Jannaschia sp. Os4]MBM2575384.1 GlsB/YeaQ/YmgE family stress response membrane protein [Jannaschia sp. Os4]